MPVIYSSACPAPVTALPGVTSALIVYDTPIAKSKLALYHPAADVIWLVILVTPL